jgi:hypothetical protein
MTQPSCSAFRLLLEPRAAEELDARTRASVDAHLRACDTCLVESAWIGRLTALLREGLVGADRAALRRLAPVPRTRRWTWIAGAVAAAALVASLMLLLKPPGGLQGVTFTGRFSASRDGAAWAPFVDRAPASGEFLRAADERSTVRLGDGSIFEFRRDAVFTIEASDPLRVKLHSGFVGVTFPRDGRTPLLLPAGEVRGASAGDGGAVSIELKPQGGTDMHPKSLLLSIVGLAGAAQLVSGSTHKPIAAGETVRQEIEFQHGDVAIVTWLPQDDPKSEIAKFVTEYRKALVDRDEKKRTEFFDRIVGRERAAIDAVRAAFTAWEKENGTRHADLKKRADKFKEEVMKGGDEKALYELYKPDHEALQGLDFERRGWVELTSELLLRESLSKGTPVLDTVLNAVRSFEHFGDKKNWAAAAKCVASKKEADAKEFFATLDAVRAGWAEKQRWNAEGMWNGQSDVKVAVFGFYNGFDATGPGVRFPGARGVATLAQESDGTLRLTGVVKGDHVDLK